MSELRIAPKPAIVSAPIVGNGFTLSAPVGGSIVQVLGHRDEGLPTRLRDFCAGQANAVRLLAPDQWLVVLDSAVERDDMTRLNEAAGDVGLVNQTHGRTRIRVEGPRAVDILAKGTAVDLDPTAFSVGASAVTLVGHIVAQLTRIDADIFELLVLRGFADSLWDDLRNMAAEYMGQS